MATIKVGRLKIGEFAGHLYFAFYNDSGQLIKQINAYGTDPVTGLPETLSGDGGFVKIFDNYRESGTIIKTIFSGSQADIDKVFKYIDEFKNFINPNSEYLPYRATPDSLHFNSNSGFNTIANIISLAVTIDQIALQEAKDGGIFETNPGVTNDILRGQTWSPIFDGSTIIGSRVVGTSGADKMNNGKDGNDVLIGMGGDDLFGSIPPNTYRPTISDYRGVDGSNTIYGGSEVNKVLYDLSDGKDSYLYEVFDEVRSLIFYSNRIEVLTYGKPLDTDILYSIELVSPKIWMPENKSDFRNLNGTLQLKDLTATELAALQVDNDFVTSAVNATVTGGTTTLGNFGSFVGTAQNDSFTLRQVLGRTFDGHDGQDLVSYQDVKDSRGMTINLHTGTAFVTGTDLVAGPSVGGPYDALLNIENTTGSNFNDVITGNASANILNGGRGSDTFIAGLGNDTIYGDAAVGEADYYTSKSTSNGNDFLDLSGLGSVDLLLARYTANNYSNSAGTATGNFYQIENVKLGDADDNIDVSYITSDPFYINLDAGNGIDTVYFDMISTDIEVRSGLVRTDSGIEVKNIENINVAGSGSVIVNNLGYNYSLLTTHPKFMTFDYSDLQHSIAFNYLNGTVTGNGATDQVNGLLSSAGKIEGITVFGSNYGDTVTLAGNYFLGTGNDIVNIPNTVSSYYGSTTTINVGNIYYSGGDDVVNDGINRVQFKVWLAPHIQYNDIAGYSFSNTHSAVLYSGRNALTDITINFTDGGSLTLNNIAASVGTGSDGEYGTSDDSWLVLDNRTIFFYDGTYLDLFDGTIKGTPSNKVKELSPFDDVFTYQDEYIHGYSGDDILTGLVAGKSIDGGSGNDIIYGTSGNDNGIAELNGGFGNDTIYGYAGDDKIVGGQGNDFLYGGDGNDLIRDVSGSNELYGGNGNDVLRGGSERDIFDGGVGNDEIFGGSGADVFKLSSGTDVIFGFNASEGDRLDFFQSAVLSVSEATGTTRDFYNYKGTRFVLAAGSVILDGIKIEDVLPTFFNDSVYAVATSAAETYVGGSGIDFVDYSYSNAAVNVNIKNNILSGGYAVGDVLIGIENIIGSSYADNLKGDAGVNVFDGGAGNDQLYGDDGNDTISGGDGNDVIQGGLGNDILYGNVGTDTLTYSAATAAVTVNLSLSTAQDTVNAGIDTVSGFENLIGSGYMDTLTGDGNNNVINGGSGSDVIEGGGGDDTLVGGSGTDTVSYSLATSPVSVSLAITGSQDTLGAGRDRLSEFERITGSIYSDSLIGDANANTLIGGEGDDILEGGAGDDVLSGGNGYDTASYKNASAVNVTLAVTSQQNTGGAGLDTLSSIQNLIGSAGNDTLTGNTSNNMIEGGEGDDILDGGAGTDTISFASAAAITFNLSTIGQQSTGAGLDTITNFENILGSTKNDTLTGDANANVIEGGKGDDVLDGAAGTDTLSYKGAESGVIVSIALSTQQDTKGAGFDKVSNFERLIGSSYDDTLTGNSGTNQIEGGAGNDIMDGGAGTDTLSYQSATAGVTANLSVTAAQNTLGAGTDTITNFESLTGSAYNDVLTGNSGSNTIRAGAGDDTIIGGGGTDTLYGEAGLDIFGFDPLNVFVTQDTISDFSLAQGDKLDISDLLSGFDPLTSAITDFVRITDNGTNSFLAVDADGGANNFIQIATLSNVIGLTDEAALRASGNLITL